MTPYPPPATSSYPGLVQLPSGMTALSDWLDQALLVSSNVIFNFVTTTDLTVTHAATIQGVTVGAGLGSVSGCIGIGSGALSTNISGTRNTAFGNTSLEFLTTGIDNVAIGSGAGENIVGGGHNVFVGTDAAKLVNAGSSATAITESIVIGDAARVSGASNTNTIVIGSDGRGEGSNTTVIGNTSTTGCHLFGTLKVGDGTDSTKTATLDCSGITTGTNRTLTLPNASGTLLYSGGPIGTPSSGVLANATGLPVSTGISGLGTGVATFLATPSSANLAAAITDETGSGSVVFGTSPSLTNATINQAANGDTAIKSVRATDTTPTGNFLDFQNAAAVSIFAVDRFGRLTTNVTAQTSTAERLLQMGVSDSGTVFSLDNGTINASQFAPTFNSVIEQTIDSTAISFFGTKGVDNATNPAILFLYRHNNGGGNTDLSSTVTGVEFRNRATKGFGFTGGHNFQMCGSATLASATASIVSQAGVDNGGNREWQLQPAAGGFLAFGNNKLRRVPTANQDVYDWFPTVNTTDNTVTTLATIPITSGRTYMIEARVAARRTGGSSGTAEDGASYCRRGTYTTKSGTVTLMGSVQTIGTDAEDQAGWDVTMTISSTNVLVRVTGATNNNVTWMGDIKIQSVAS
ncbi:hypothetical protein UFOVP1229_108 [uncultured Caudovirales phage]|uniref:Uncharacterized protein n=1 Tax=uncultured Caudovirales phage TaxID=2100421 RepID=A0A6J5RHB5_9CAUD|nr:hypothetical protein UFOVP1229_108 [uncultured Caudovirales phage]